MSREKTNFVEKIKKMFRLKELREKKGITQLKLAMDLHMNQNSISRYETEQREADYKTLIAFADYFSVSVDYLIGHSDKTNIEKNKGKE